MSKNWLAFYWFVVLIVNNCFSSMAQSIILRPYIGYGYYGTKPDQSIANHFDSSYRGINHFKDGVMGLSVELKYKKQSFELEFTKQNAAFSFYTFDNHGKRGAFNISKFDLEQFRFIYNKFFDNQKNLIPFLSSGFRLGINQSPTYCADTSFTVYRVYSAIYPNEYIDVNIRTKGLAKITYSLIFKAGVAAKFRGVERARFTA